MSAHQSPGGDGGRPPDQRSGGSGAPSSWANRTAGRIRKSERENKNALEISVETEKFGEPLNNVMIENLFGQLAIRKGDIEGIQLVPVFRPKKIFVWFREGIDLLQFCRQDCFRLAAGVKTGIIRPKNKKEVEVLVRGLDIDTPDGAVIQYFSHFGTMVRHEVVHVKYEKGPFSGLKNGDRKYLMDFSEGQNMGSYHLIDGAFTTVSYFGQRRTCGRCQGTASTCPGEGTAKVCEERGGMKVAIKDHMKALW